MAVGFRITRLFYIYAPHLLKLSPGSTGYFPSTLNNHAIMLTTSFDLCYECVIIHFQRLNYCFVCVCQPTTETQKGSEAPPASGFSGKNRLAAISAQDLPIRSTSILWLPPGRSFTLYQTVALIISSAHPLYFYCVFLWTIVFIASITLSQYLI